MILGDRAFVLLHDPARLHVVLFCFACPEIMVIEYLFFFEREIRGRGGNVGLHGPGECGRPEFFSHGQQEGEAKFLSHKNGVSSLVFLVVEPKL